MGKKNLFGQNYITTIIGNLLDRIFPLDAEKPLTQRNYSFIKTERVENYSKNYRAGIYKTEKGKLIFVKNLQHRFETQLFRQVVHEARMLRYLNSLSGNFDKRKNDVNFPKLMDTIIRANNISLITEYIKGKTLSGYSREMKVRTLIKCIKTLRTLSHRSPSIERKNIPIRYPLYILMIFPLYVFLAAIKDIRNSIRYIKLAYLFYKNYISLSLFNPSLIISHRDLHSNNIMIHKNKATIIDTGIVLLAEEETDPAIVALYYHKELGIKYLLIFLNSVLKTGLNKKKFTALTIFYAIQMIATQKKYGYDYNLASDYAKQIELGIIRIGKAKNKKSGSYEKIKGVSKYN